MSKGNNIHGIKDLYGALKGGVSSYDEGDARDGQIVLMYTFM